MAEMRLLLKRCQIPCSGRLLTTRPPSPTYLPQTLDGLLRAHAAAAGPYFAGEQYSLAEAAATPVVQRAAAVLPAHRGIDFWQLLQEAGLDRWA